ncbi:MAG: TonB-dependent receptor [Alphaproteobacteria bacterium]|nr:TonB-dependent receptor [Alphaproteobacteria bacterium]
MSLKAVLAGSASVLALVVGTGAAFAQAAQPQGGSIETVVVTGIRASNQRAIDIKHQSVTIVDAVSAEDIGKLPDKNVADALQRVPGVTTFSSSSGEGGFDENNRIAIRGTNPSLTQTMVDGHTVATGDWFILDQFQTVGRSVAFDLFPAEIVDSVKVYKSQQADMVEGGTAGSVDIVTRKPLDFSGPVTTEASAQGVYADLPGKIDPQVNALFAWHNTSDNFGIMVQAFYEERHLRRDGQEFLGYNTTTALTGSPVLYPTLIGSALFQQHRKRAGGDFNVQWRPNASFDVDFSGFYSHLQADNTNNNFMAWIQNEIASGNTPTSMTIKNGTLVAAEFPKINPNTGNVVDGVVEDSIYRPGAAASTWFLNADALWIPAQHWNVHAKIGYTEGEGLTPSQPTWESDGQTGVNYNFTNGGPAAVAFPDINTADAAQMNNDWAWSDMFTAIDQEFYTQADITYDIDAGALDSIEVGGRYAQHIRNVVGFDEGTCAFACPGTPSSAVWSGALYPTDFGQTISGGDNILSDIWLPDWSKIQSLVMPQVTPYSPLAFYWPGSFKTKETDTAAYAQANFKGARWRGNLGFRFVQTDEDIFSYVSDVNGKQNNYGAFRLDEIKHTYTDPLPSANLTYDLTEDAQQQLQFAASRVISRPDYSALGGAVSLVDSILTGTGGNPDLKPIRAWTFSGAWNWYYAPASLVSIGAFYMDLTSYVDFGVHDAVYLNATLTGQQGHPVYSTYAITSPLNTSGTDEGIELAWQQPLWGGFGMLANYTLADGEQANHGGPLLGDAKHTANATLYYEQGPISTRIAYTWRSSVLIGLDRSTAEHQASIGNLDASASYDINGHFAVTFDVLNLTDDTLKYYANTPDQPRAFYANGRQFFLGVRAKY